MSGPQVYFTLPSFGFIPDSLPRALPPPVKERSFRAPFGIDKDLFNFALRPEIPITFAILYIITVFWLNGYNKNRNYKPWWIARQRFFKWFVVIHNALLTVYSAATFAAMCRAIAATWPGWNAPEGVAGIADALCKIHGPRGIGDATTYNTTINIWEAKNTMIKLGYDGNPDPTDVGRLWNEGLAFWGWVFYVSKFYEVLDTMIILAKGKRSATLQTYHHSGAMLCMWAGIRYMSPPIWMFVFVNSFIHALMYTYFTLSAVGVRVPNGLKRSLTTLQIAQFLWGASYAAAHLFIQYDMPIATPYQVAAAVQAAASSVSSAASAATSTVSKVVESPPASGTLIALAKKLLLRAVGEEGIAERVTTNQGQPIAQQIEEKIEQFNERTSPTFETRWRTDWTKVNCIDTSGEAFAIYLNLLYLAPLTFLFARFFVKAYTGRGKARRASHAAKQAVQSGQVAHERLEETVEKLGQKGEDIIQKEAARVKVDAKDVHEQLRRDVQAMKDGTFGRDRRVSDRVQDFERQVKTAAEKAKEQTKKAVNGSGSSGRSTPTKKQAKASKSEQKQGSSKVETSSSKVETKEFRQETSKVQMREQRQDTVAEEALDKPAASSEPERKQDANLEASEATRPGATDGEDKENSPPSVAETAAALSASAPAEPEEKSFAEAVKEGPEGGEQEAEPEEEDGSLFGSQISRGDDTDAMGRSGAIVDFAADKAEDAKESAEEVTKPRP